MDNIRIGQGFDVHRLVEGRLLMLGGVEIPFEKGLDGHSDADVLTHTIIDALLGAAGMGDIGRHFPDTDAEWKDANSLDLLKTIWEKITAEGWQLGNIDATVLAERPKLALHIPAMQEKIAAVLGVSPTQIHIKATTTEKLGFTGRGEGIAAMAVTLLCQQ
jgi:2-C-methyl-D-erythritol 2,4-cyclodiphosphate synthase